LIVLMCPGPVRQMNKGGRGKRKGKGKRKGVSNARPRGRFTPLVLKTKEGKKKKGGKGVGEYV